MRDSPPANMGVSVQTGEIDVNAVTAAKIATNAVTTLKINALAVTLAKMAADSVDDTKIKDNAIKKEHFDAGAETNDLVLKLTSDGTALEWGSSPLDHTDSLTIEGATLTLGQWLLSGFM